jgi:hypothetical protein
MDKLASWKAKQEEEAKKRREAPEARQLVDDARGLLDEATEKFWSAGELELANRVHGLLGVLWGVYELEDLGPERIKMSPQFLSQT